MKVLLTSITLTMLCLTIQAQHNLVPNGNFEANHECPSVPNQWTVSHWQSGNGLTPDYYHLCGDSPPVMVPTNLRGHQYPKTGEAYVGLWAFSVQHPQARDYIQVELEHPLHAGVRYVIGFHASLAEHYGGYAISTLGAALTAQPPTMLNEGLLDANPQVLHEGLPLTDTVNWVLICDTVLSRGGNERYLTIGNFHTDAESDTTLFNPLAQQWRLSYYFIDDVSVIALDSVPNSVAEVEELNFSFHPNPVTDVLHIQAQRPMQRLHLYDLSGRAVLVEQVLSDRHSLNLSGIPPGIYLLEVSDRQGRRSVQKMVVQ